MLQKSYSLKDVDTDDILISTKIVSSNKNYIYFIAYIDDYCRVKPLSIVLPKTSACIKRNDGGTTWRYFLIEDGDLLKKYSNICDKASSSMKKEFDSESIYNNRLMKPQ